MKPELTSAPVWLELQNVPFQFFNDEGLEHITGMVGHPKFLHPSTANKTNLEVAKVFTLIDPRKPLPEAVNVQFDSGEISRVMVSSPWMPPICEYCKGVGHNLKRCKVAPILCTKCTSTCHETDRFTKPAPNGTNSQHSRRYKAKEKEKAVTGVRQEGPKETSSSVVIKHGESTLSKSSASVTKGEASVMTLAWKKKTSHCLQARMRRESLLGLKRTPQTLTPLKIKMIMMRALTIKATQKSYIRRRRMELGARAPKTYNFYVYIIFLLECLGLQYSKSPKRF